MSEKEYCPFCDSTELQLVTIAETFTNRAGEKIKIKNFEYTLCNDCDEEFVTAKQARHNEKEAGIA
ncbi:hypothetical protein LCGC14_1325630 [marine sediment metagenome]|uniref:YgiT-type zinc finger domain-containing protein n=1 Tax=marine sediment metagenome TaxID=412755 RepID=A0A0F9KIS2_9ZZZZ